MTGACLWLVGASALLVGPVPRPESARLADLVLRTHLTGAGGGGWRVPGGGPALVGCGGAALVAAALFWRGPLPAAALGLVALAVGYAARHGARRRAHRRAAEALLAAVRLMTAELAAGSLEPEALRSATVVAGPFAGVLRAAADSATAGDLAGTVSQLSADPETVPLAAAWQVRAELGVPLGSALAQVERELTDRLSLLRTVAEVLAGPRASAMVLAGLPVVGLLLAAQTGAHPVTFLTATSIGRIVLLAGAALTSAGLCWSVFLAVRAEARR